jgi:hypothetical protein
MNKDNAKAARDSIAAMAENYKKLNGVEYPKLPSVINPITRESSIVYEEVETDERRAERLKQVEAKNYLDGTSASTTGQAIDLIAKLKK